MVTALRTLSQQRSALTRALACSERPEVLNRMHELLGDPDLDVVAAASEVLIFHHAPLGTTLSRLLASDDPVKQVLGMKALADGPPSLHDTERLLMGLAHEVPVVAAAAMEVGCRLGFGSAWQLVKERAAGADRMAMLLLALGGGPAEYRELLAALSDAARRPSALWALGFVGTPETVDASLEWLNDRQAGPLAGEVFTAVTGVNLAEANLTVDPEETEALDHAPEDDLPLPDPVKVRHWWKQHRGTFTDGQRYLMGEPRSWTGLLAALLRGSMRRRSALLLDLQLRCPEKRSLLLQPRAPTRQQYAELAAIQRLDHVELNAARSLF
ncbi:hypothetical protein BON30_03950 [Cystobacter ferrugineus]|uniref:TIGR02270 family protein n=1 Tax=Cystobacter ferrugineus TaxID=83449 RepID=A0A1L9BJI5_9BACT|nr:hypothetical protein BON30_03950 [Cystobacter ferrugineus]